MSAGSTAAVVAAAAKKHREQQEEEEMTQYSSHDLDGWEFKIVRSLTGKFSNREAVQRLCTDEARAGWEMIEKFDNNRIRFKRKIERRSQDQSLGFDPYRTSVGMGEGGLVAIIFGIIVVVIIAVLIFAR